jgi:hypothetical protein
MLQEVIKIVILLFLVFGGFTIVAVGASLHKLWIVIIGILAMYLSFPALTILVFVNRWDVRKWDFCQRIVPVVLFSLFTLGGLTASFGIGLANVPMFCIGSLMILSSFIVAHRWK